VPAFAALAAGTLDRAGYIALLQRLWGFHDPVETVLATPLAARLAPDTWQRAHLLRADLACFGITDPDHTMPRIKPPLCVDEPSALGALYVIEGSTLGGWHLARQLDGLLGPGVAAGRRFLQAGGSPGRLRWAQLGRWLDTVSGGSDKVARMLEETRNSGVCAFRDVVQRFPGGLELPIEYTTLRVPGGRGGLLALGKNLQAVAELQSRLLAAQQATER